jgi:NitT/TauT family transport system substrate-binding protein
MADPQLENELGFPVEWVYYDTGPAMMTALFRNELDVGYLGLTPAMIGIAKGVPILCVAGGHIEGTILCANSKYKTFTECGKNLLTTFQQFIGKTIGVPKLGSIHSVILLYYLKTLGLEDQIFVTYYDEAEFIALDLMKHLIDAGVGTPALSVFAESIGETKLIIPPAALWSYNPSYGIFFHKTIIAQNPDVVTTFLKQHYRAEKLLNSDPEKAAELIASVFKIIDAEYVARILKISPKYCIALDPPFRAATIQIMHEMVKMNLIARELHEEEIFTTEFVNQVHSPHGHYNYQP